MDIVATQEGTFSKPGVHDETGACAVVSEIIARIGDKWSILVVVCLSSRPQRFNELRRLIGSISQKMLTQTLRNLERDGFVLREVTPASPPRVTYSLTALGQKFESTAIGLAQWASDHKHLIQAAQKKFDANSV